MIIIRTTTFTPAAIRILGALQPITGPDFKGREESLNIVLEAEPDILNHNMETVKRLQKPVRVQARYDRSLEVLRRAKARGFVTKTGLMLGRLVFP